MTTTADGNYSEGVRAVVILRSSLVFEEAGNFNGKKVWNIL